MQDMQLTNDKLAKNSLTQSAYEYFRNCVNEFSLLQPAFNCDVYFGTNMNNDYGEEKDKYNMVVFTGIPDIIPSHWQEVNGDTQILYAGYLDMAVSVVNPISIEYNDTPTTFTTEMEEYTGNVANQVDFNEISEDSGNKIDYGMKLLEAFALFMRRKNIKVDGFAFTSSCEIPSIDGEFDESFYRLTTTLNLSIKFAMLNDLGSSLYSGEDLRLWISFDDGSTYDEVYNVLDFRLVSEIVDKSFPLMGHTTTKDIVNQLSRNYILSCPQMSIGGADKITQYIDEGNLQKINNCRFKVYDGKKYKTFTGTISKHDAPVEMDKFNSLTYMVNVTSEISEV